MHAILTVTMLAGLIVLALGLIEPGLFHTTRLRAAALGLGLAVGGLAGVAATLPEEEGWSRAERRIFRTRQEAEDAAREVWAGAEARMRALQAGKIEMEGKLP